MKKLFLISEEERGRILNMHQSASQKQYLKENKSNIFKEESLITEARLPKPIRRFIDKFFKGKKKYNPEDILNFKTQLKDTFKNYIDDAGELLVLVRKSADESDLRTKKQEAIDKQDFESAARIKQILDSDALYEIKTIPITEDLINKIIKEESLGFETLLTKDNYDKLGGLADIEITLKGGKLKKLKSGSTEEGLTRRKITPDEIEEIMKRVNKDKMWRKAKNILTGLVKYSAWASLATIILGFLTVAGDDLLFSVTRFFGQLFKGGQSIGDALTEDFPEENDKWIKKQCELKPNTKEVRIVAYDNFFKEIFSLTDTPASIKAKLENFTPDDIGFVNQEYPKWLGITGKATRKECFWEELLVKMGDKDFYENVLTPINKNIKRALVKLQGITRGETQLEQLNNSKEFPNKELNKTIIEGFSKNCPCVFYQEVKAIKIPGTNNTYHILLEIGDNLYSNTCNSVNKAEFEKKWNQYNFKLRCDATFEKAVNDGTATTKKNWGFDYNDWEENGDQWQNDFNNIWGELEKSKDVCEKIEKDLGL